MPRRKRGVDDEDREPITIWVKLSKKARYLGVAAGRPGTDDKPGHVLLLGGELPVGGGYSYAPPIRDVYQNS